MRNYCSMPLYGALIWMLSGCVVFPEMAKKSVGNENALTCRQLDNETSRAESLLQAAKDEDYFRPAFLFPPTGFLSLWNIMRAQSRAKERIDYIAQVKSMKRCPQAASTSGYDGGIPMSGDPIYIPRNRPQPYVAPPYTPNSISNSQGAPVMRQPHVTPVNRGGYPTYPPR